jgi:predicted Zn-dependent protease
VADHPRIEELKRRVEKDPASVAFAALAEEYRRAGNCDEAIRLCRSGLARHPGYLSAHVTLGRALLDTGQLQDAQDELEQVVHLAPDNLAAVRALAEIRRRRGEGGAPAQHAELDPILAELERWLNAIVADRQARRSGQARPEDD